jgi:hypothetical protein
LLVHFEVSFLLGMPDFAAREVIQLAAETPVGKIALAAADRALAEVMDSIGLKKSAGWIRAGVIPPESRRVYQSIADDIASGKLTGVSTAAWGPVKNPLQFPERFFEGHRYSERISGTFGDYVHRVIPKLPEPSPRIMAGDTVSLDGNNKRVTGELLSIHPNAEAGPTAVVRLHKEQSILSDVNASNLEPINARLWRNESGAVFSAPPTENLLPDAASLKFLANVRAVEPDKISFVSGVRTLPKEAEPYIANNNALIKLNAEKPESFLFALSSAPKLEFAHSPLVDWRSPSIFNPRGLSSNCMACTAGIVRTLRTGAVTTAEDVAKMTAKDGTRIGEPFFGRFENEHQAFQWFSDAAKARIVDTVSDPAELKAGRNYALTINLNPRSGGGALHMAFAHRFSDGSAAFYDGQSGIQWSEESFVRSKLPVRFHELEFTD